MTKVDIFSGFLGAGKTTLIKKLVEDAYKGEKVVLIENEFGEIGIDSGFLKDAGIEINEMNSGCICCSLVGDFGKALEKVESEFNPDRILIEPSGVGKLSDIITAVKNLELPNVVLNGITTVVDGKKVKVYSKNFGEFYNDQVEHAATIIISHVQSLTEDKIKEVIELLKEKNQEATIVVTDWDKLTGSQILEAIEQKDTINKVMEEITEEEHHRGCCGHGHHGEDEHGHDHHHDHHEGCCGHGHHGEDEHGHDHHHDHHEGCCVHGHHGEHEYEHDHHHDHHEGCCGHGHNGENEHGHDHHHDHHEGCCGHGHHGEQDHEHDHEHHHHADEVFDSIGIETGRRFNVSFISEALSQLSKVDVYGQVLRAKGIVEGEDGNWIHFDYVPEEIDIREGSAGIIGRICVIGAGVNKDNIHELFEI